MAALGAAADGRCVGRSGTAVNWAAATGAVDVLRLLTSRGADLTHRDMDRKSPAHDAALTGVLHVGHSARAGGG
jgi:ankyrin repeat protein